METTDLAVHVRTPSRLHFGLLAFGDAAPRQFGGVGVMIERPETEVLVRLRHSTAPLLDPMSVATNRAHDFAVTFLSSLDSKDHLALLDRLEVCVPRAPAEHMGLGSGTQLAMAIARALAAFVGESDMTSPELARRVGRGKRSAIGVHGFQCGGFIVEAGKRDACEISPLVARLNFPAEWHFVLVIPTASKGLHGPAEREAFECLAPIPPAVTADLCRLTLLGLLPGVAARDFAAFSESLFEFGQKVGQCFAAFQGGVYSNPIAADVVAAIRRHGISGIAQSSWGPTLCAVTDSRVRAEWLAARLADTFGPDAAEFIVTPANNLGARTEIA